LSSALAVLLFQSALVVVIYWPTRRLGFVSDAWVHLERVRQGLWAAVATPVGYHWQPVGCAWIALIRGLFGERPAIFQAIILLQLTLVGHLTYQLGRRILPDAGTAFLASLLFLGSAAFYEVTYWALEGNMHLLAAQFYVLAVLVAYDMARGRLARSGPWLLGLTALGAVFTYLATVTVLPVCALTLFFVGRGGPGGESSGRPWRFWLKALIPLAAVGVLFAVARVAFAPYFAMAPQPGLEPERVYWLVRRGLLGLFSLRGSYGQVDRVLTLGTQTEYGTVYMWICVGIWLVLASAIAAWCLWRARTPGLRVLVAFLGMHLLILALASPITPRGSLVPAVPAALLTAWALRAGADRLAARVTTAPGLALCRDLPAASILLLVVGAQADHASAARVHTRVTEGARALVERIKAVAPPDRGPVDLTLINMPDLQFEGGIAAFAFLNGLPELAHFASPAVGTVDIRQMPSVGEPEYVLQPIPVLTPAELRAHVADPHRVVLLFEKGPFAARMLTREDIDRLGIR
jgi:hypothetical protein